VISSTLQQQVISILQPYEPIRIGVFGSYARGENTSDSDLDILIKFKKQMGLLKFVEVQQELSEKLDIEVDLVTENSLKNPRLKKYIQQDLITIYEWKRTTLFILTTF